MRKTRLGHVVAFSVLNDGRDPQLPLTTFAPQKKYDDFVFLVRGRIYVTTRLFSSSRIATGTRPMTYQRRPRISGDILCEHGVDSAKAFMMEIAL